MHHQLSLIHQLLPVGRQPPNASAKMQRSTEMNRIEKAACSVEWAIEVDERVEKPHHVVCENYGSMVGNTYLESMVGMAGRGSLIGSAGTRPEKEDLLQSKIRSSHWYRCIYSLSKYHQIYSASQVVRQDI